MLATTSSTLNSEFAIFARRFRKVLMRQRRGAIVTPIRRFGGCEATTGYAWWLRATTLLAQLSLGNLDGLQQTFGFVNRLFVLGLGNTVVDYSGPGLQISPLILEHQRP